MLTELYTWWKEQMRDLVPVSLRPSGRPWRPVLVAAIANPDMPNVALSLQGRRGQSSLGQFPLHGPALREALAGLPKAQRRAPILQLSSEMLLDREIVVPLAAEQDLAELVANEMDRLTPFRADEVFWTCSAGHRDRARNRLHVRLTIVLRPRVQPILAALQEAGFTPVHIEALNTPEPRRIIPLGNGRQDRGWFGPRVGAAALAGCGLLAAVAIVLPFVLQSVAMTRIDRHINAMKPLVMEAKTLRSKIESGATTADSIASARAQVGTPLQSLAMLTDVLADDTFLTSLAIRQRKVVISGRAVAAARLIGAMAANPLAHNPAFTAPVVRDEVNGGEMFSITAELGG